MKKLGLFLIAFFIVLQPSAFGHDGENDIENKKFNGIENYDVITISQPGVLYYSVTDQILESVKNLDSNVTFIGRANVGLEKIIDINNVETLSTNPDYLYSLSVKSIESKYANLFYTDEITKLIKENKIIISKLTADQYSVNIGDKLVLVGMNEIITEVEVGEIIPDSEIGWFEAVVSKDVGYELGINRNIQAIIWDSKVTENHFVEIYKNIKYKQLRVTFRDAKPNKNWVLPTALVKNYFGDFQIKEKDGTWIIVEPAWRNKNIERKEMPIIGRATCNKIMWKPLLGALNQVIDEGLENTLYKEEFQKSGGCYAPRRINRFNAGGSISRHAWGIAIDINVKSGYHPRVVEIFNEWGFAWGGTWTSPDEMHFELRDLSPSVP
ncbi:M15 family metallopeptidase [Acidimicrobiaceae bacterium]|nr:M15 family metallopeptidase [Acidimicrobiaceae bacterium]